MTAVITTHRGTPGPPVGTGSVAGDCSELNGSSLLQMVVSSLRYRVSVSTQKVTHLTSRIVPGMPRLWTATVEAHRDAVRQAVLDAAWDLAREHGPLSLTMSQIARKAGIGRATLYKYFPDFVSILRAYHRDRVAEHLKHLHHVNQMASSPRERLRIVLVHYAEVLRRREHPSYEGLSTLLHADGEVETAHRQLTAMLVAIIEDAVAAGQVRSDLEPALLADFCLSALGAVSHSSESQTCDSVVSLVLDSLKQQP